MQKGKTIVQKNWSFLNICFSFLFLFIHTYVIQTGNSTRFGFIFDLNHWHYKHIRSCFLRLHCWFSKGRFVAIEQLLFGCFDNCRCCYTILFNIWTLYYNGGILWISYRYVYVYIYTMVLFFFFSPNSQVKKKLLLF